MRRANVDQPPGLRSQCHGLGLSVLTNASHFGMNLERFLQSKLATTKPVLRKDFIFDEYQVFQARAFGADAILLMANLLEPRGNAEAVCRRPGIALEALFECHTREQILEVPPDAVLYGINSRTFDARKNTFGLGRYGLSATAWPARKRRRSDHRPGPV